MRPSPVTCFTKGAWPLFQVRPTDCRPIFRISTATSDEILAEAVARIGAAVAQLETGQEAA